MILFDNQLIERKNAPVDIEDRGYQFGDGVYEVIRVYGSKPFYMQAHLDRFARSAHEIRLELPYGLDILEDHLKALIEQNNLVDGNIYLQLSRGVAPRSHPFPAQATPIIVAYVIPAPRPLQALKQGVHAITTEDIRWLRCDIKSLNLLGAVLAKQEAVDRNAQEAILHRDGILTEGSATNVFIVKDGTLYTHPANNLILHGITRAVTLTLIAQEGLQCIERPVAIDVIRDADEIFLTGTTVEVTPVTHVNGHEIGTGKPGPITKQLQQAFEQLIAQS
ncbi:D-amino-acid transaminase [Mechercharimyces sp. CAU 1602]|uniref:D-amino-acid transaminase n=1 Tax=Mechercharimyces sp. CAU 1602 TaxID=2973933 RepID=UPI0021616884|nr:D-amino-acid transaminase [Mechercharimyces sp. CAU 1602]MCS1350733.1 D-amino-acid transaminase [Mechercharimyces sp. CAU 1602]